MTTPEPATGRELQEEIEQTRERLGQTVEELVAKADVKARAQAKAAEVKVKAQGKAAEVKVKAQDKAADVKNRAVGMSGNVRQSQLVQLRWPLVAVVAGVILIGSSFVVRRRQQR